MRYFPLIFWIFLLLLLPQRVKYTNLIQLIGLSNMNKCKYCRDISRIIIIENIIQQPLWMHRYTETHTMGHSTSCHTSNFGTSVGKRTNTQKTNLHTCYICSKMSKPFFRATQSRIFLHHLQFSYLFRRSRNQNQKIKKLLSAIDSPCNFILHDKIENEYQILKLK